LGHIENKTITVDYWYTQGRDDRLAQIAAEIINSKPDVIVTSGTARVRAFKEATSTIPIVATSAGDLVGRGIVTSFARPGGNITGLTSIAPDISGKRLEILREMVPSAKRVGILYYPYEDDELKETVAAARILAIEVRGHMVNEKGQFPSVFASIQKAQPEALVIFSNAFTSFYRKEIVERAMQHALPTVCDGSEWVDTGCLVSYSPNRLDLYRRAAAFVDKILKGRKPADLPVEQPITFELVVNLKTAKALGLTIPPTILVRADRVIR
jgi:putative ABC transport system substrate-binding protein